MCERGTQTPVCIEGGKFVMLRARAGMAGMAELATLVAAVTAHL